MRPKIVVSGVNLVDLGPLAIFRDALTTLVESCGDRYEIVALAHSEAILGITGVTYMEFPQIKGSWLKRLHFEYFKSLEISRSLRPDVWIAMHDITPRVECRQQFVYCHNPSPFYQFSVREAFLDPKFGMFTLFYRFLYGMFLQRNAAIIVQQDWIRKEFEQRYGARNVVVAHPGLIADTNVPIHVNHVSQRPFCFFYPAFPRTFKNHELILLAVRLLVERGIGDFEVLLTVNAASNPTGANLFHRYGDLPSVRWLGSLSRAQVDELYGKTSCLLFPSKLETWGLPLTEFRRTGKPILAANLPYAHETVGTYGSIEFFNVDDAKGLADIMAEAIDGSLKWRAVSATPVDKPFARNWTALWDLVLSGDGAR